MNVPLKIGTGCIGPHDVLVSLHDTDFRRCCSRLLRLPTSTSAQIAGVISGTTFAAPNHLQISVLAGSKERPVSVSLFADGELVGTDRIAPYGFDFLYSAEKATGLSAELEFSDGEVLVTEPVALLPKPRAPPGPSVRILVRANSQLEFTIPTEVGQSYALESAGSFDSAGGFWKAEWTTPGDGTEFTVRLPIDEAGYRFFRVRAESESRQK